MLFSRKLITKFIPDFVNITDDKLIQVVNALGMEIESITKFPDVDNIVVGELVSYKPVEGTHLNLCKVRINAAQTNTIVCGASGLIEGAKVLVALEGAKLPNGITIQKRMIHGMESNGMMCAYSELTNNEACVADAEKDEIIMLKDAVVGSSNWKELIGADDTIYDVTVPANRNDENSYLVFCYELAHKLNLKFNFDLEGIVKTIPLSAIGIRVDSSVCSFLSFTDYLIDERHLSRSPWTIKSTLMNHGIKPINQLLDRLALITLMTNCPTHVYDADKLQGNLSCRLSSGELKFVALNNKTYTLAKDDVLICDQTQPVSIAAVIGSDNTKVTSKTSKVRIEVGNFSFANVRNTSIRLNCETDASKKASRPISVYLNLVCLELIKRYLGETTKQIIYCEPNWNKKPVTIDYSTLHWFINESLSKEYVLSSLKKLGYQPHLLFGNKFKVPAWRLDVSTQEDIFEDILKIIDMNKLKPISVTDNLLPIADNNEYDLLQSTKDILLNNYFSEVKTYNLTNKSNLDKFNLYGAKNPIKIICNNSNREYFRMNLLDNMLKVYKYNDARKLELFPIFEIQKLFTNETKYTNVTCLSLDKYYVDSITHSKLTTNLNYYKSIVNQIAQLYNASISFKPVELKEFYNNETLSIIYKDQIIGYVGKIKFSVLKDYDLANKQIYALSINIDKLFNDYKKSSFHVKPFGIFQRISKDINITLDKNSIHLLDQKLEQIRKVKDVADAKVINIFNKDNLTIYTVRYYLVDTRQFNSNDLEYITKQIEKLGSL